MNIKFYKDSFETKCVDCDEFLLIYHLDVAHRKNDESGFVCGKCAKNGAYKVTVQTRTFSTDEDIFCSDCNVQLSLNDDFLPINNMVLCRKCYEERKKEA